MGIKKLQKPNRPTDVDFIIKKKKHIKLKKAIVQGVSPISVKGAEAIQPKKKKKNKHKEIQEEFSGILNNADQIPTVNRKKNKKKIRIIEGPAKKTKIEKEVKRNDKESSKNITESASYATDGHKKKTKRKEEKKRKLVENDSMATVTQQQQKKMKKTEHLEQFIGKDFSEQSPDSVSEVAPKKRLKRLKHRRHKKGLRDESEVVRRIILVENVPIKMMHSFKGHFEERFSKYGKIHHVGACEFDEATADKEFKTSIVFQRASSATKALDEDNLLYEGNRLVVRKASEAKDTTLVVRKINEFKETVFRTIFSPCGSIRRINCVKKPQMDFGTVFVEFWRPESLKEAMHIAADVKIGGRKLSVGLYNKDRKPANKPSDQTIISSF